MARGEAVRISVQGFPAGGSAILLDHPARRGAHVHGQFLGHDPAVAGFLQRYFRRAAGIHEPGVGPHRSQLDGIDGAVGHKPGGRRRGGYKPDDKGGGQGQGAEGKTVKGHAGNPFDDGSVP